jgi:hypothetical protein
MRFFFRPPIPIPRPCSNTGAYEGFGSPNSNQELSQADRQGRHSWYPTIMFLWYTHCTQSTVQYYYAVCRSLSLPRVRDSEFQRLRVFSDSPGEVNQVMGRRAECRQCPVLPVSAIRQLRVSAAKSTIVARIRESDEKSEACFQTNVLKLLTSQPVQRGKRSLADAAIQVCNYASATDQEPRTHDSKYIGLTFDHLNHGLMAPGWLTVERLQRCNACNAARLCKNVVKFLAHSFENAQWGISWGIKCCRTCSCSSKGAVPVHTATF